AFFWHRRPIIAGCRTHHRGVCLASEPLKSTVDTKSPAFTKNSRRVIDLVTALKNTDEHLSQGGGAKAIDAQHKKGRLTARERIKKLIVPKSQFFELSIFAAFEMYEEWV